MLKFGKRLTFKHTTLVTVICLMALNAVALQSTNLMAQGPESGGGGSTVKINESQQLIDYFLIPQALTQVRSWDAAHASAIVAKASDEPIEFSHRKQQIENKAFTLALEILERWAILPFDSVAFLMQGSFLSPLRWNFVDDELFSLPAYRPPALDLNIPIFTAANYAILPHQLYLVRLSRPIWNQMPLFHQAGLVLHEVLRQVQLGKQSYFNDESLQKATAIFMLCKPSLKLNQYAHFLTLNAEAIASERLGSFEDITKDCRGPE